MKSQDIRKNWIKFFKEKKNHLDLPSASLVPNNPTLLLTNAGMVPFVPYFLGQQKPPASRISTVQKCVRVGGKDSDLENIGKTSRHLTFFEMLGNFSFGDYFKEETIPWSWELLTQVYGFKPEELIVSVFAGDDTSTEGKHKVGFDQTAFDIWTKKVGVPESRILKLGRADNFWGPPGGISGPCGPCSEIYYAPADGSEPIEIWNLVFMQYEKFEDGSLQPLPKPNVDTGAGLERLATILQKKESVFETDLMKPIIDGLCELAKAEGFEITPDRREIKIIADHLRCSAFLIADEVKPSNLGRGYILRMLIRRAARFAKLAGFDLAHPDRYAHMQGITSAIQSIFPAEFYPEIHQKGKDITDLFKNEINAFNQNIERGLVKFNEIIERIDKKVIDGEQAFDLYATYGFPVELTIDLAEEKGFTVDLEGYEKAKQAHSEVSNQGKFAVGFKAQRNEELKDLPPTEFIYKHSVELTGFKEKYPIATVLYVNDEFIVLDKTPFYPEGGGQLSDCGSLCVFETSHNIENSKKIGAVTSKVYSEVFKISDVQRRENTILHLGKLTTQDLKVGDQVYCFVDVNRRRLIEPHHTATHLLHAALRKTTNNEAEQRGSLVSPERLRFDFTCSKKYSDEQIETIENLVNETIKQNAEVKHETMSLQEAMNKGALAFFGDKYGDEVKVLTVQNKDSEKPFSIELCGGTHVKNTSEIQGFKIISESAISSGVRRIEAVAGQAYIDYLRESDKQLDQLKYELKVPREKVNERVQALQEELKAIQKKNTELEKQLIEFKARELLLKVQELKSIKVLIEETELSNLKEALDSISSKVSGDYIFFLVSKTSEKMSYAAKTSFKEAKGYSAKDLVGNFASSVGGSGGGRPDYAQGGGGDKDKTKVALDEINVLIKKYLQ